MRKLPWSSIKHSREFKKIMNGGVKFRTPFFIVFFSLLQKNELGIIASKKVGCAVKRNRAKRLLRNIFTEANHLVSTVFIANAFTTRASYSELQYWFQKSLKILSLQSQN